MIQTNYAIKPDETGNVILKLFYFFFLYPPNREHETLRNSKNYIEIDALNLKLPENFSKLTFSDRFQNSGRYFYRWLLSQHF